MKKVFFVLLLLASIFLIGNAEVAAARCQDYQDYECTYIWTQYGEIEETGSDCIELCYDNGFEVDINDYAGMDVFYGYLYPATNNKHLLGTAYDYYDYWTGCSVEFKGKSMTTKLAYIENGNGYEVTLQCKPCDHCCH